MRRIFIVSVLILLIGIAAWFLNSCKTKNLVEDLHVVINKDPVETMISVEIMDGAIDQQIGINDGHPVTVKIFGQHADDVVTLSGEKKRIFETRCGLLNFAVEKTHKPSPEDPFGIILMAQSDGYLTTSLPIWINSTGGHSFILNMVSLQNPPQGVLHQESASGSADAGGRVVIPVRFESDPEPVTGVRVSFSVPENTVIRDRKGVPLSGPLTASVTYFNNRSEGAMQTFPGGFAVNLIGDDRVLIPDFFITYGCASIILKDESGRKARSFDSDIEIGMEIPSGTKNWQSGQVFKVGDKVPVWIYHVAQSYWYFDRMAEITGTADGGNLKTSWKSRHLSVVNMDDPVDTNPPPPPPWPEPPDDDEEDDDDDDDDDIIIDPPPPDTLRIRIVRPVLPPAVQDTCPFDPLIIKIKRQEDGVYFQFTGYITSSDPVLQLIGLPCGIPSIIEAWSGCPFGLVASIPVEDLCSVGEVQFDIPCGSESGGTGHFANVQVTLYGYCPNEPDVLIGHNIGIWINDGCRWKYAGRMINGKIMLPRLQIGQLYVFGIWHDGELLQRAFTVTSGENEYRFEMPPELCD